MRFNKALSFSAAAVLVLGLYASALASSQIGAGVVIHVKENGYTYRITYNWYLSGWGEGTDKCAHTGKPQETRIVNQTHCLLNGSFIARGRFLDAVRIGLRHLMFSNRPHFEYPCIWTRDLDEVIGALKGASDTEIMVTVDLIARIQMQTEKLSSCA